MTPQYDVLLKGGRIIDPAARLDGVRDLAVKDGLIAEIAAAERMLTPLFCLRGGRRIDAVAPILPHLAAA